MAKRPDPKTWILREPVRLNAYAIAGGVIGLLALFGVISDAQAEHWISLAAMLLGVVSGTEAARSMVDSPATVMRKLVENRPPR